MLQCVDDGFPARKKRIVRNVPSQSSFDDRAVIHVFLQKRKRRHQHFRDGAVDGTRFNIPQSFSGRLSLRDARIHGKRDVEARKKFLREHARDQKTGERRNVAARLLFVLGDFSRISWLSIFPKTRGVISRFLLTIASNTVESKSPTEAS